MDSRKDNAAVLVEAHKQALQKEAQRELYDKLGETLADFPTWPSWTVENANISRIHIYTLIMKVVFKP
ncbi:MAG: hypothetical protein EOP04_32990 [Proteobacteria bacterium]|nr:MAG: hypothetical protein EOP04_32990 [Pseudomonadota bacterium]